MPCTIRPQTIMLADNMRVEFAEEKHGEHVITKCTITNGTLSYRLRFDPRGDLVMASTAVTTSLPEAERPAISPDTGEGRGANA